MDVLTINELLAAARTAGQGTTHFCSSIVNAPMVMSVAFSPVRLILLVGWLYACLYCCQRIELMPAIPKEHKGLVNLVTIFLGPVVLAFIAVREIARTPRGDRGGMVKAFFDKMGNIGESIKAVTPAVGSRPAIRLLDSSGTDLKEIYGHGKKHKQDSHILHLTEEIIWEALQDRASDVLIDPRDEMRYSVRYRVDGVLREVQQMDTRTSQAVINSIKAVSSMDISERRRPQDGAFIAKTADGTVSFRVASAGVFNGEKIAIRVLSQDASMFTLDSIGLSEKQKRIIQDSIAKPSGMVLMCGPTGSGKTTTLYAMLNAIDFYQRNVVTVEDPVEYVMPNMSQIEVNPKAGITFAKSLRSILRQDPDVICVGEIRDEETAAIALQASQTGHLVLATLHSNSPAATIVRLLDLEVSPLLVASGLSLIVSQRLVRKLCTYCRQPAQLSKAQMHQFEKAKINYSGMMTAVGCEHCHETGYYGRTAIYDIIVVDDALKASISDGTISIVSLRKEGDVRGKSNLQKQGMVKVVTGVTSLEELHRVIG